MKTSSSSTPTYHFIDIAPLAARYSVMTASLMGFMAAGRMADVLTLSRKVHRLVRVFTKLEAHNARLKRKLEMLSDRPWRDLVVKELGGLKRLKRWEASYARIKARFAAGHDRPLNTPDPQPAWLLTPERIAESERLKSHARKCGRATAHPRVFRDRYRMDFAGEFRLAPLPRAPRGERVVRVYTESSIVDYDWNNIPIAKVTGFGPAMIWPAEVFAAIAVEAGILDERNTQRSLLSSRSKAKPAEPGPNNEILATGLGPASPLHYVRDDKIEIEPLPLLSLKDVLSRKVYDDLCGSSLR